MTLKKISKLERKWYKAQHKIEHINEELANLRDHFIQHELGINPYTFKLKNFNCHSCGRKTGRFVRLLPLSGGDFAIIVSCRICRSSWHTEDFT